MFLILKANFVFPKFLPLDPEGRLRRRRRRHAGRETGVVTGSGGRREAQGGTTAETERRARVTTGQGRWWRSRRRGVGRRAGRGRRRNAR